MRRRRLALALAGAGAAGALSPAAASAHGLVGRADLPIPAWLFGWAAAVVLIVSFLALAVLWPQPRLQQPGGRELFRIPGWVVGLCGLTGVAVLAAVVYAGFAGTSISTANLTPTFVYVIFWVGLPVASVLLGNIFSAFNPWRAIGRAVGFLAGRVARGRLPEPLPYPERLGRWPAVVTILAFAWLELVYVDRAVPAILAGIVVGYTVVQLVGMSVYGVQAWCERAEGFGVLFGLYARLSVFERREDGRLYLRLPLAGAPSLNMLPGTIGLLCVAIGSTTFDGFENGAIWNDAAPKLVTAFRDLGAGFSASSELAGTVGLAVCVAVISVFYELGISGMRTVGGDHEQGELARRFAHTLIPIAFAYALAHYFSLLAYQGQAMAYLVSDPLGNGANLIGTANAQINYNVINTTGIWYVQVGALVVGHVAGLALAHDRALALYRDTRDAVRSQAWMLVVMVGFTSLGLWLLSAATT